ncbi:hypothetical protein [Streptomyces sp. NPDC059783]|uniref:hypothetical protein n=1 Tax=Streptomyces sp. NPDC059783 TaxID=3346944 RepID=UPI003669EC2B
MNTRYLDAAVEQHRSRPADQREHGVLDQDAAVFSTQARLNILDRYSFRGSGPASWALRPRRDPAEADHAEDPED